VTHRGETCREEEEDATDLNGDKDMVNGAIDVEYSRDTWEPGIFFSREIPESNLPSRGPVDGLPTHETPVILLVRLSSDIKP